MADLVEFVETPRVLELFHGADRLIPVLASSRPPVSDGSGQEDGPEVIHRKGTKRKGYVVLCLYLPVNATSDPQLKKAPELQTTEPYPELFVGV